MMKFWVAYLNIENNQNNLMFLIFSSLIAKSSNVSVGLISSERDRDFLLNNGCEYSDYICGTFSESNGAKIKLRAILEYLPDNEPLIDGDVFITKQPSIDTSKPTALNYEPLRFYRLYKDTSFIKYCLPRGDATINAGLLYMPPSHFRKYAEAALDIAKQTDCIGHTYEQMFFVKYCQDNNLELNVVYPKNVHSFHEIEEMFQSTGIRHPFCFKRSFLEKQNAINLAKEILGPDKTQEIIWNKFPYYKPLFKKTLFKL